MGAHSMNRPASILSSFLLLLVVSACKVPEAAQKATSSSSGTTTTVGVVDDSAGFWVKPCKKYEESQETGTCTAGNHLLHKQTGIMSNPATDAAANYNQACKVNLSDIGTANAVINCTVEADELELAFYGLAFAYNVPSTMCEYFGLDPYYFWNYKPSSNTVVTADSTPSGPAKVTYTLTVDGKIKNGSAGGTAGITVNTGMAGDALSNSDNTGVACKYDYSKNSPAGPNCCEGKIESVVYQEEDDGNGGITVKGPTSSVTDWGGKVSNCLAGPAMMTQDKNDRGFPARKYFYVAGTGISSAYVAHEVAPGKKMQQSYLLSNHFNAFNPSSAATFPDAFKTWAGAKSFPFYDFVCLDRDDEVLARIRITVREWNTLAELNKYRAAAASANPDSTAAESGDLGGANDWKDLGDVGASSYPESKALMDLALAAGSTMSKMTPDLY